MSYGHVTKIKYDDGLLSVPAAGMNENSCKRVTKCMSKFDHDLGSMTLRFCIKVSLYLCISDSVDSYSDGTLCAVLAGIYIIPWIAPSSEGLTDPPGVCRMLLQFIFFSLMKMVYFHIGHCRSKIRLRVMCSLILSLHYPQKAFESFLAARLRGFYSILPYIHKEGLPVHFCRRVCVCHDWLVVGCWVGILWNQYPALMG